MADPFITLNGDPGEFLSRADDNRWDADSAHIQQGRGAQIGSASAIELSPDVPMFGDNSLKITPTATTTRMVRQQFATCPPVVPGNVYAGSIEFQPVTAGMQVSSRLNWYDIAGGVLGSDESVGVPLTVGEKTVASVVATAPALAATAGLEVIYRTVAGGDPPAVTDILYAGKWCTREGSDPLFVPSLRIVQDLDIRSKLAAVWTQDGTIYARWPAGGNNSVTLNLRLGGQPGLLFSNDGAVSNTVITVGFAAVDNVPTELRFINEIGVGSSWFVDGNLLNTSADIGSPFNGSGQAQVGQRDLFDPITADIEYVEVRDGIDGPVVYRMDAADALGSVS